MANSALVLVGSTLLMQWKVGWVVCFGVCSIVLAMFVEVGCISGGVVLGGWLVSGTNHRPVFTHLLPRSTIRPLYRTVQEILSNVTVHPALVNLVADNSE